MSKEKDRLVVLQGCKERRINPTSILSHENNKDEYNPFLTLGLIRNDITDLIDLYDLFLNHTPTPKREISGYAGIQTGKTIYITRLIFSTLYEFFVFLEKSRDKLENNDLFTSILEEMSDESFMQWKKYNTWANAIHGQIRVNKLNATKKEKLLLHIMRDTRMATFHYHSVESKLREGFRLFFFQSNLKGSDFAYYSDDTNIQTDRSFYVDASIDYGFSADTETSLYKFGSDKFFIDALTDITVFLNFILSKYHSKKLENIDK